MKLMYAASFVLFASSGASAAFVDTVDWITDIRRCSASFSGNGSGSSWQDRSIPFDGYEGGADIMVSNGVETWSSHCTQESSLAGTSAMFEAQSNATIVAGLLSNPLQTQSQAKFDMWFTVAERVEYAMHGEVTENGHLDSMAVVRLFNIDGDMIENIVSSADSSRAFNVSGILQPGTYRLYGESLGKCRTLPLQLIAEGTAACRMSFSVTAAPVELPPAPRPKTMSATVSPPRRR